MLGKISYGLVPLVLISAFLMIRYSYYNLVYDLQQKPAQGLNQFNNDQILQQAATNIAIAFFYFFLFALFYSLAIINKRNSAVHSRYMMAHALTLLGPTVDRIVFFNLKLPTFITYELPTLIIIDILLVLLLLKDYKDNRPTKTLWICLLIYVTGQVLYFTIPLHEWVATLCEVYYETSAIIFFRHISICFFMNSTSLYNWRCNFCFSLFEYY